MTPSRTILADQRRRELTTGVADRISECEFASLIVSPTSGVPEPSILGVSVVASPLRMVPDRRHAFVLLGGVGSWPVYPTRFPPAEASARPTLLVL